MSVTVCQRGSDQETTMMPAVALSATRAADFEELFGELVEEAGRPWRRETRAGAPCCKST